MTEALEAMCAFLMEREQTATAAAQRFGMHLHDQAEAGITFTPRDRRFSEGSASREWKQPTLNAFHLTVAKEASLTVGALRARFGHFSRISPQHYDEQPRWIGTYSRADRSLNCRITFQVAVPFLDGDPADDVKIDTVTLIPEMKR